MGRLIALLLFFFVTPHVAGGPSDAFEAAFADADKLPLEVRRLTRYVDFETVPEKERDKVIKVWKGHANQLSREPEFSYFRRLGKSHVYALVLKDYAWKREVWENLAKIDPYYHEQVEIIEKVTVKKVWPGGKDIAGNEYPKGLVYDGVETKITIAAKLAKQTLKWKHRSLADLVNSEAPLVDALWLFVQTARQLSLKNKQTGAGYYDFLGIKDRKTYEEILEINTKKSINFGKEKRAALDVSGVAEAGRQIEWYQALGGGTYRTLDTDDPTGRGNPIRNLKRGEFVHKAEEHYGALANRLFAFLLCDANGGRQDSAPDFIGPDDSPLREGKDGRIHICLACIRCHVDGLRPINDWARRTLKFPLGGQSKEYEDDVNLRKQYFSNLDKQLKRDREDYAEALLEATGFTMKEWSEAFAGTWNLYVLRLRQPIDVARQMGVTEEVLLKSLVEEKRKTGRIDLGLSGLLQIPPVPIRAEHLEELMGELWRIVGY